MTETVEEAQEALRGVLTEFGFDSYVVGQVTKVGATAVEATEVDYLGDRAGIALNTERTLSTFAGTTLLEGSRYSIARSNRAHNIPIKDIRQVDSIFADEVYEVTYADTPEKGWVHDTDVSVRVFSDDFPESESLHATYIPVP